MKPGDYALDESKIGWMMSSYGCSSCFFPKRLLLTFIRMLLVTFYYANKAIQLITIRINSNEIRHCLIADIAEFSPK